MFCPRCGTENPADNRFCVSCGQQLGSEPSSEGPRKGIRERLGDLVGRSRRERLITGGTALAVIVAIVALLTLDPEEDDETPAASPESDAACVEAKKAVAKAATEAQGETGEGIETYSADLIAAMLEFRAALREAGLAGGTAAELDLALRDAAIEAGALARLSREGATRTEIGEQALRIDAATRRADQAIEELGLERCASVRIVPAGPERE